MARPGRLKSLAVVRHHMAVSDAIERRLEVREYADESVDDAVVRETLDAARLAPSGKNLQHWRFVLVDDDADLERLADLSTTGFWVDDAAFAVVVCTDPEYHYHHVDAGRAITHMQFAAYRHDVGSCIYTGFDEGAMHEFLEVPLELSITAVVGFGYPADAGEGRKDRKPLSEVAFRGRFGEPFGES